jgi:hypothetical protein
VTLLPGVLGKKLLILDSLHNEVVPWGGYSVQLRFKLKAMMLIDKLEKQVLNH